MRHDVSPLLHSAASGIGWVAAAAGLAAYALLTKGRMTSSSLRYLLISTAGSAGLALSMFAAHAWQSMVVNLMWLVFGISALFKEVRQRRSAGIPVAVPRPARRRAGGGPAIARAAHSPRMRRGPVSGRAVGGATHARTAVTCTPNGAASASTRHSDSSGSASPSADSRSARSASAPVSQGSAPL